jgi:hypothetical protein
VPSAEEKETTRGRRWSIKAPMDRLVGWRRCAREEAIGGNGHGACREWISHSQCFVKKPHRILVFFIVYDILTENLSMLIEFQKYFIGPLF